MNIHQLLWSEANPALLDTLAQIHPPTRTLIHQSDWRTSKYDADYPDYQPSAAAPDVPLKIERANLPEPDATMALPIAFGLVNSRSDTARNTLDELEKLRNARWFGGGYECYRSSGQCDQLFHRGNPLGPRLETGQRYGMGNHYSTCSRTELHQGGSPASSALL